MEQEEVLSETLTGLLKITEEFTSIVSEDELNKLMCDCLSDTKLIIDWMDTSAFEKIRQSLIYFWNLKEMDKKLLDKHKITTHNFFKQMNLQKATILQNQNKALKEKIKKIKNESEALQQELKRESDLLKEQTKIKL